MIANKGTPKIMPARPNKPPNMVMENNTQNPDKPVESPNILGPRKLPSNCCNKKIKIIKYKHCTGLTIKTNNALGIAPKYGPKNGITFVMPTITLINKEYGI